MRVAVLASGSSGNATVVEAGGVRVLVDCGISLRQLGLRLAAAGLGVADLQAVLVTHEHDIAAHAQRTIHLRDGKIERDERRLAAAAPLERHGGAW